ncbi:MAG: hypothetical protein Kow0092_09780 [Deferrisomatales bacterium]
MSAERTEALLLRATPYGEADLVAVLLSPCHGRVAALAKGARRSRRRFGGVLDYFNLLEVQVRPGRSGLGRLLDADLLRTYAAVRRDVEAYRTAGQMLEIAHLGSREGAGEEGWFGLVRGGLEALDGGGDPESLVAVFQVKALAVLGYGLDLDRCPRCGRPYPDDGYAHRPAVRSGAAVVCRACGDPRAPALSLGALRTLQAALGLPPGRLGRLRVPRAIQGELGPVLEALLAEALGARPKSWRRWEGQSGVDRSGPPLVL